MAEAAEAPNPARRAIQRVGEVPQILNQIRATAAGVRQEIETVASVVRQDHDALVQSSNDLRIRIAGLEGELKGLQAGEGTVRNVLTETRESIEQQVRERRKELREIEDQAAQRLSGIRKETAAAEQALAELGPTRQALADLQAELAAARRLKQDIDAEIDQARKHSAAAAAEKDIAERQRDGAHADLVTLGTRREQLQQETSELAQQRDELKRAFRPLLPYTPPADRCRLSSEDATLAVRVERLDFVSLKKYQETQGVSAKQAVMEALRNYLPHAAYRDALAALEEEAEQQRAPAGGSVITRVPPGGAGAAAAAPAVDAS